MTQRAKPVTPRARRSASERSSRRTLFLNIAFLGAILLGTATLIGAAFASYAGTHWAEVANINGVSINRDQAQAAANVDLFKLTYQASQLRDDLAAGRISQADYDAQSSTLTQAQQNVSSGVVDALADDEKVAGKPRMIVAKTIKGKGVSYMENACDWHGKAPNEEQVAQALCELCAE